MAQDVRQRITNTALRKQGDYNGTVEAYRAHIQIWEEDDQGVAKSRFIILSCTSDHPMRVATELITSADDNTGKGFIHKSRQDSTGTFSIGKTRQLEDLCALEVLDVRHTSLRQS